MKGVAVTTAFLMLSTIGALAQQPPPPGSTAPPAATTRPDKGPLREAHGPWSVKDFLNTAVYNMNGERIGDVNDITLDDSGKIASVVVGVGGFLGIGEKDVALSPDQVKRMTYNDGKTYFTVNATKQELESAPKYTRPRS